MSTREGEAQLALALHRVEYASLAREEWLTAARQVAEEIAQRSGTVTSDEVRLALPVPDGWDPRILGAVFRHGTKWKRAGIARTTQSQAHARPITVWALKGGDDGARA